MSANNQVPDDLITEHQQAAIIAALQKSYLTAQSKYDEEDGDNSNIFGYGVHFYTKKNYKESFADNVHVEDQDVKIYDGLTFRMHINNRVFASYRVGKFASQDISRCFPHNSNTAPKLAEENNTPFLIDVETGKSIFDSEDQEQEFIKNWVIAHLGNPETGLEAVYLCAPGEVSNGRISSWKRTHQIYMKTMADGFATDTAAQLHPEVEVPDFVVTRKKDKSKIETL
ncbi:MAG: hypothetical protein BroJett040_10240 [Oligoflexia bacterium]|nr:MAG: hypothetical protein BroJett040_10240 [Oligoflexia bacterium]